MYFLKPYMATSMWKLAFKNNCASPRLKPTPIVVAHAVGQPRQTQGISFITNYMEPGIRFYVNSKLNQNFWGKRRIPGNFTFGENNHKGFHQHLERRTMDFALQSHKICPLEVTGKNDRDRPYRHSLQHLPRDALLRWAMRLWAGVGSSGPSIIKTILILYLSLSLKSLHGFQHNPFEFSSHQALACSRASTNSSFHGTFPGPWVLTIVGFEGWESVTHYLELLSSIPWYDR